MNGEINFEFVKDKDWDVVKRFLLPILTEKQTYPGLARSECVVMVMPIIF